MKRRPWLCLLAFGASLGSCLANEIFVSGEFGALGEPGALYLGDQRNAETIAFGNGFLVLWDDKTDGDEQLYLRLMDAGGEWQTPRIELSIAGGEQKRPAAVEVGDRAFFLWEDDRNGLGTRDLYGTFLSSAGVVEDRRGFLLLDSLSDKSDVELAAIGEVVVAVWEEGRGAPTMGIHAMRIGPDGALLDDEPSFIAAGSEPVIAAGDGEFLIVFQDSANNLEAQRVSAAADGDFLLGAPQQFHTDSANGAVEPVVAWNGECYGVAWIQRGTGADAKLQFARIGGDGVLVDTTPVELGAIEPNSEVDLVADARGFVVVARLGERDCGLITLVEGASMELAVSQPRVLSQPRNIVQDPSTALATDGTLLIAWEDEVWETGKVDGENLFTVVGDAFGELSAPRVMLSWPAEVGTNGIATVRDGDGYGIFWRSPRSGLTSARNSSTIFYSKISAGTRWQPETEVIGGVDGPAGMWALSVGGETRAYWRTSWSGLQTITQAQVESGLALQSLPVVFEQGWGIEMGSDGQDVLVLHAVFDANNLVEPRLTFLDGGVTTFPTQSMEPGETQAFSPAGVVGDGGNFFVLYRKQNLWAGRRIGARMESGPELAIGAEILVSGMTPGNLSLLGPTSMLAWPNGVEIVVSDQTSQTLLHIWIPWGAGEAPVVTPLDASGTNPKIYREGNRTFLLAAALQLGPRTAQRTSWQNHDPSTATDPEILDFFLATLSPGNGRFFATRPLIDAGGRVLIVRQNGGAAFSSEETRPRITRFGGLADGRFDLELQGLPFGVFELHRSTDLQEWEIDPVFSVPLDRDGIGSVMLDSSAGEARRFWRGVYRPH